MSLLSRERAANGPFLAARRSTALGGPVALTLVMATSRLDLWRHRGS
jgi:hypothetical protein